MPSAPDSGSDNRSRLSRGRLIVKNTLLSIGGQAAVMLVALLAVPILIDRLGTARFGVLTLVYVVIGYAGLFDLGLGRALTKLVSEKLGAGKEAEIPRLFWTSLTCLAAIGTIVGIGVAAASGWLSETALNMPDGLRDEARATFLLLAASIPFVLVSSGLRGTLEAQQRFDLTNALAVPISILSYFGPVVLALFSSNLAVVTSAVVASRVLACAINLAMCSRVTPGVGRSVQFDRRSIGPLLRFGGWVTVAAIAAPMMLTLDRFLIGATLSATAVAYYTTPYEAITRMLIVSSSFAVVLFPAFSISLTGATERAEALLSRSSRAILVALFPFALVAVAFAPDLLQVWVGDEFSENSTTVMQWFAAGVLVNGMAQVSYGMLQSSKPHQVALLQLAELPLYLGGFFLLLKAKGVQGAAMAWTIRATVDGVLLWLLLRRARLISFATFRRIAVPAASALLVLAIATVPSGLGDRLLFTAVVLAAGAWVAWRMLLEPQERDGIDARVRALRNWRRRGATAPADGPGASAP